MSKLPEAPKRPRGRPPGALNKVNIVKEAVKNGLENLLYQRGEHLLETIYHQALNEGCRQSQKMLLDRLLPVMKADDPNKGSSTPVINLTIGRLEDRPDIKQISGETLDAD